MLSRFTFAMLVVVGMFTSIALAQPAMPEPSAAAAKPEADKKCVSQKGGLFGPLPEAVKVAQAERDEAQKTGNVNAIAAADMKLWTAYLEFGEQLQKEEKNLTSSLQMLNRTLDERLAQAMNASTLAEARDHIKACTALRIDIDARSEQRSGLQRRIKRVYFVLAFRTFAETLLKAMTTSMGPPLP